MEKATQVVKRERRRSVPHWADRGRIDQGEEGNLLALPLELSSHLEGDESHPAEPAQLIGPVLLMSAYSLDVDHGDFLDRAMGTEIVDVGPKRVNRQVRRVGSPNALDYSGRRTGLSARRRRT